MSNVLNEASLVLIPSGYKSGKVYSQIPENGNGDLSFTRSNDTATRVNSAGLIEKVRTNLALYSEDFTNAAWVANAAPTITANTTVAPNGTTTADTIASAGANSGVYQLPSVSAGTPYAFSVYVKNISSASAITIGCDLNPINGALVFNAVSGTITSVGAGITASSVTNEGNGWYRVFGTYVATGSPNTFLVFGGGVMSFAVWGAMFQAGDILTSYIPTTSAAVSVGMTANVPRLDYSGGGCPKLLLEGQRTNLVTYSEQFNNAAWGASAGGFVRTANATIAPDGTMSADRIQFPSVDTFLIQNTALTAGTACAGSVYVKGTAGQTFSIAPGGIDRTPFTLNGEWQRITHTATAATDFILLGPINGSNATDVFLWGAQLEAGSYPTSYIPTLGAAVTRGADACLTGSVPSLIGQTEGTLFVEMTRTDVFERFFVMLSAVAGTTANSYQNSVYLFQLSNGGFVADIFVSNVTEFASNTAALSLGTHKIAIAYKQNDFALYVDGVQRVVDTSGNVPAMNFLTIAGAVDGGAATNIVNQTIVFPTRLTNTQLAELTTL